MLPTFLIRLRCDTYLISVLMTSAKKIQEKMCLLKLAFLLFMLANQSKDDDEDKNNGDGDEEDKVGRHQPLIWRIEIIGFPQKHCPPSSQWWYSVTIVVGN